MCIGHGKCSSSSLMNISRHRRRPISSAEKQSPLLCDLLLHHKPNSEESDISARRLAARLREPPLASHSSFSKRLSFQMESVTKWDYRSPRTYHSVEQAEELVEDEPQCMSVASSLRCELWKAQLRIKELEAEKISSEKKIKLLMTRQGRSREEQDCRPVLDYLKHKLRHERKERRRAEAVNSRLLKKVSDSESLMKRVESERDAIEEVCEELVGRIEALRAKTNRIRDETEEERQMLQMAEVWREERVKMKLVDAKLALQEKYEQMNRIVSEFEKLLKVKRDGIGEKSLRRAGELMKMARSMNVSDHIGLQHLDSMSEDTICNSMY